VSKIFQIALREFIATVATKGFIIGIVIMPIVIIIAIFGLRLLLNEKAPRIEGRIAIIDPTGEIHADLAEFLQPEAIAERRGDLQATALEGTPEELQQLADSSASAVAQQALATVLLEQRDEPSDVSFARERDRQHGMVRQPSLSCDEKEREQRSGPIPAVRAVDVYLGRLIADRTFQQLLCRREVASKPDIEAFDPVATARGSGGLIQHDGAHDEADSHLTK